MISRNCRIGSQRLAALSSLCEGIQPGGVEPGAKDCLFTGNGLLVNGPVGHHRAGSANELSSTVSASQQADRTKQRDPRQRVRSPLVGAPLTARLADHNVRARLGN
jgi:hypothetical protein